MFKSIMRLLGVGHDSDHVDPGIQPQARLVNAEHHADRSLTGYSAFTLPPNRPDGGPWRISHERVTVAGVHAHTSAVRTFARDVDAGRRPFGIHLEREPGNPHDANAIRVIGRSPSRPAGAVLGYIPRELAAELAGKEPIAAEAHRHYESGNYTELMIHVLERIPTKAEETQEIAGIDAAAVPIDPDGLPHDLIAVAKQMKHVGRRDDAAILLERIVEVHSGGERWHGAIAPLTAVYRQRKEWEKELALLELLFSRPVPRGRGYEELRERLETARKRAHGA